jgi:hypothetical protein
VVKKESRPQHTSRVKGVFMAILSSLYILGCPGFSQEKRLNRIQRETIELKTMNKKKNKKSKNRNPPTTTLYFIFF